MKHIHIVSSSPRSGTTLLFELMTSSFHIDCYPKHEARIGKKPPQNCDILLTKSPKDTVVMDTILKYVSNIYVLFVLRDPRDSAVSIHKSKPDHYYGSLRYWFNYMPYYERFKDHSRVLTVKYEDLVVRPDAIQEEIHNKLSFLEKKYRFSQYTRHAAPSEDAKKALGGVRQINTSSIGNWRNHKYKLKKDIEKFGPIADDLIRFGYEDSKEWRKELIGIDEERIHQHVSPFSKREFIRKKRRTQILRVLKVWWYHSRFFRK
ncbi:MAG: sulfotransferase family protein [Bacteroidetes bacterium]|jgi:hypothetical protein|nr:sulfotransferase family protein [Bacteroidota bacterium]